MTTSTLFFCACIGVETLNTGMVARGPIDSELDAPVMLQAPSQEAVLSDGLTFRTVKVGSSERRYLLYVPRGVERTKTLPVVLAFHGGGGNPTSMMRLSGLNQKADSAGFVLVYPFGSGLNPNRNLTFNAGNVGGYAKEKNVDDVSFTRAILDDLPSLIAVDKGRVYATGISNGAMMCYRIASELADRIVAIAPVGGPMGLETCNPSRPVSIIHFHGTADELAPFAGGKGKGTPGNPAAFRPTFFSVEHSVSSWVKANGCRSEPKVDELPDRAQDGMRVTKRTWSGGREGSTVVLVEIAGGGHTWPGEEPLVEILGPSTRDISANDMIWEFFQSHRR